MWLGVDITSGMVLGMDVALGGGLGEIMALRIHLGKHLGLGERVGLGVNGALLKNFEDDVVLGGVSEANMVFGKNAILGVLLEVVFGLTLPEGLGTCVAFCVC